MSDDNSFIPFHLPSIGEEEIREVEAVLRSGWLTSGPRTAQFEREFQAYVGAQHALAVNSCTAGLHLALSALDLQPGDEVITTPYTFCATVNAIYQAGATPVLADIRSDGNIDPRSIADRLTPNTRGIVPVHLAGLPCEMDEIWNIARKRDLFVVEDAAHAVGTQYKQKPIGSQSLQGYASDAVAFSFYATKNLTTGEGGMVTTQNEKLANRMRVLCLHGITRDAWNRYSEDGNWFYQVVEQGFKYNLSDIQSAIGIHQLRRQERFIAQRERIAEMYTKAFSDMPELRLPQKATGVRHCWHLYIIQLNLDLLRCNRAAFIQELKLRGIGASVHFIPVQLHPAYAKLADTRRNHCPASLHFYERALSLPLYPAMSETQVQRVISAVQDIVARHRTQVFSIAAT